MNGHAFDDVARVIQHSQRASAPACDLAKDGESPGGRNGSSRSPFGSEPLSVARRDWKGFHHAAGLVDDEQSLSAQIDFHVRIVGLERRFRLRLRGIAGGRVLRQRSDRAQERRDRQARDIACRDANDVRAASICECSPCFMKGAICEPVLSPCRTGSDTSSDF